MAGRAALEAMLVALLCALAELNCGFHQVIQEWHCTLSVQVGVFVCFSIGRCTVLNWRLHNVLGPQLWGSFWERRASLVARRSQDPAAAENCVDLPMGHVAYASC